MSYHWLSHVLESCSRSTKAASTQAPYARLGKSRRTSAKSGQKAAFYDPAPTPTPHTIPTPYSKKPPQTPNDRLLHTNIIRNLWLLKDWYDRVSPADIIISPVSHHQLILVLYQISGISVPSNLGLCVQWSWKKIELIWLFCPWNLFFLWKDIYISSWPTCGRSPAVKYAKLCLGRLHKGCQVWTSDSRFG